MQYYWWPLSFLLFGLQIQEVNWSFCPGNNYNCAVVLQQWPVKELGLLFQQSLFVHIHIGEVYCRTSGEYKIRSLLKITSNSCTTMEEVLLLCHILTLFNTNLKLLIYGLGMLSQRGTKWFFPRPSDSTSSILICWYAV